MFKKYINMYDLEKRMKENYEKRHKFFIPRRTNIIIRLDGKAFHTLTRGMNKPYDKNLMSSLDYAAWHLCQNIQNAKMAYIQSDEISLLVTDYDSINTEAWFDNEVQKIASVSSSLCTAYFNQSIETNKPGCFDSRVFAIPDITEVYNYFIWRQKDAIRNSIMQVAQSYFSHKELHGLSVNQVQEKLWQEKNINWNDYNPQFKRGRIILKANFGEKSKWIRETPPTFTSDRDYLPKVIFNKYNCNNQLESDEEILENLFNQLETPIRHEI